MKTLRFIWDHVFYLGFIYTIEFSGLINRVFHHVDPAIISDSCLTECEDDFASHVSSLLVNRLLSVERYSFDDADARFSSGPIYVIERLFNMYVRLDSLISLFIESLSKIYDLTPGGGLLQITEVRKLLGLYRDAVCDDLVGAYRRLVDKYGLNELPGPRFVVYLAPGSGKTYAANNCSKVLDWEKSAFYMNLVLEQNDEKLRIIFRICMLFSGPKIVVTNLHHVVKDMIHLVIDDARFNSNLLHRRLSEVWLGRFMKWHEDSKSYSYLISESPCDFLSRASDDELKALIQ